MLSLVEQLTRLSRNLLGVLVAPPAVAIRAASILVFIPPFDSSLPTVPAMASISGVTRSTTGTNCASGLACGGAV